MIHETYLELSLPLSRGGEPTVRRLATEADERTQVSSSRHYELEILHE